MAKIQISDAAFRRLESRALNGVMSRDNCEQQPDGSWLIKLDDDVADALHLYCFAKRCDIETAIRGLADGGQLVN